MGGTHDGEPILEVIDLGVRFSGRVVLEHLSFSVRRGEVMTILGPNGSGKTVLLRALLGTVPCEGVVRWRQGLRIGYVPQRLPYIRSIPLSVGEFFALKRGISIPVTRLLSDVGLPPEIAGQPIGQLSSGQFQRVLIAWAVAASPDVLLFDEPTTGIDIGGEETVYALLSRLQQERNLAMLIVTHDLAAVHRLSTTVLCLNRQIVCMGPPLQTLTPENLRRLFGADVKFYAHHHE